MFQIPELPRTLSTPYIRVIRSFVLNNVADRPTPVQAFRRLACVCFGPVPAPLDTDTDSDRSLRTGRDVVHNAADCAAWLWRQRVDLLCHGRRLDEDAVAFELRAVYLCVGDGASVWEEVRAAWGL